MREPNMDSKQINKKIKKVPPHLIPEIMDYIDYLINKYSAVPKSKDSFNFLCSFKCALRLENHESRINIK